MIRKNNKNKIKTKFLYSSETKNYIFFSCYKKKYGCKGTAKINKTKKTFIITYYCDNNIEHIGLEYDEFAELFDKNDIINIDFSNKINQRYYVIHLILKNPEIDLNTIYKKFYDDTKKKLNLSKSCLSKIKSKLNDNYKNLSLSELVNKIKSEIPDLYINILDIKYDIKIKNKLITREQRIILFGLNKNRDMLNTDNINEFFYDNTFQIIPSKFRPYKSQ